MRRILLTGATGKFGRELISHFLREGDFLVFTSRSQEAIDSLIQEHVNVKERLHGIKVDLAQPESIDVLVESLVSQGIGIDCLINNARDLNFLKIHSDGVTSRENFLGEFLLDVVVPYELTMKLADNNSLSLRSVVNVGSIYGEVAPNINLYEDYKRESPVQYGVSKAALVQLTKELAVRLADKKIRVNCAAFGGVGGRVDDAFRKRYEAMTPMQKMIDISEVPGPIDYLLSDASSAITGQVIIADGGWTAW